MSQKNEETSIASTVSNDNSATRRTKGPPLQGYIVKALAEDIEFNGGIASFAGKYNQRLKYVLDAKAETSNIYGKKGDPIRLQLQRKVWAWQKLHQKGDYEKNVLAVLKIQSFQSRTTQHQSFETPKKTSFANKKTAIQSSGSSSDSSTQSAISPEIIKRLEQTTISKKAHSILKSPPAKHITLNKHQIPPSPLLTPADKYQIPPSQALHNKTKTIMALPHNTTVFEVDYDYPEKTFPIIVIRNEEIKGIDGKTFYKGFTIIVQVDQRWSYDDTSRDFLSARLWTNDSILVGIPSMPYDLIYTPEVFQNDCGPGAFKAMDAMRNKFLKDQTRQIKYFLLKFPTPNDSQSGKIELTAKPIIVNQDKENETELFFKTPEVVAHHPEVKPEMHHQFAAWNVVRLDVEINKRGKPDAGPKMSKAQVLRIEKAADALAAKHLAALQHQQQLDHQQQMLYQQQLAQQQLEYQQALFLAGKGPQPSGPTGSDAQMGGNA